MLGQGIQSCLGWLKKIRHITRRIKKSVHDLYLFENNSFDGAFVNAGSAIDAGIGNKRFTVFHYDRFGGAGSYACFAANTFFAVYFSGHYIVLSLDWIVFHEAKKILIAQFSAATVFLQFFLRILIANPGIHGYLYSPEEE